MANYIDQLTGMRMNPNPVSGRKSPHCFVHQTAESKMIENKTILFSEQKQFPSKHTALHWREQRLRVG